MFENHDTGDMFTWIIGVLVMFVLPVALALYFG